MRKEQDGQGTSKVVTPEQHAQAKAAAKARRNKNRGRGKGGTPSQGSDLLSVVLKERREQARQQRELEAYEFRLDQVAKAKEHEWFQQLRPGTVAYRFAQAALEAFPLADPPKPMPGKDKVTRTNQALLDALDNMNGADIEQENAIMHGRNVVRKALHWAFNELTSGPADDTAEVPEAAQPELVSA